MIELTPWLVSAVKIAIKEKLDDPEVLANVYPKLYFYDSGFPYKEPIPNREPKIVQDTYPEQIYNTRGDYFVKILDPVSVYSNRYHVTWERHDGSSYFNTLRVKFQTPYDSRWGFEHGALIDLGENEEDALDLNLHPLSHRSNWQLPYTEKAIKEGIRACLVINVIIVPQWELCQYPDIFKPEYCDLR